MTMKRAICTCFISVVFGVDDAQVAQDEVGCGRPVKEQAPWYHTSDEVRSSLRDLVQACPTDSRGATLEILTKTDYATSGDELEMDVLRVRRPGSKPKSTAMYVFGEHARELVTVESALVFVQALCGQGANSQRADQALEHTDFVIVPNANPLGRAQVEAGHYCKRTNADGVDLNRNWYDHRQKSAHEVDGDEENPGYFGFSEPETQILKRVVEDEKPNLYLSVHSGAYLLGAPDNDQANFLQGRDITADILKSISDDFCSGDCPYGRTTDVLGYGMEGDDTTYVTKRLGSPYAFTFEIYSGPDTRKFYVEEARAHAKGRPLSKEAQDYFWTENLMTPPSASLAQIRTRSGAGRKTAKHSLRGGAHLSPIPTDPAKKAQGCFELFNPQTQEETAALLDNWSGAFIELSDKVAVATR